MTWSAWARQRPVAWDRPLVWPLWWLLRGYRRWLSPLLPPSCRFVPSCSQYALVALANHPAPRALALVVWRLARCQPLCRGGHDPVPSRREPGETIEPI